MTDTLGDALPREMARVRDEVMPRYQEIGPAGAFALAFMRASLDEAAKALAEGDVVAMLRVRRPQGVHHMTKRAAADAPPVWTEHGTGRSMCSWCGSRWPDEVHLDVDGGSPTTCPLCPIRAPELRDASDDVLRAAALAWDEKLRRGEVPELGVPLESPYRARIEQLEAQVYALRVALRGVLRGVAALREQLAESEGTLEWTRGSDV